ncbi:MAG: CoA transferase [Hyphomicrobiales bacterium]|nr:CoA transferase [Hyphomicrobiales bacterium]
MTTVTGALSGLRIVDLTRVLAGPYCTQILADHGADVIKVEPPGGDETRAWGPPFVDGASPYYIGLNRNKRGIVLDLAKDEDRRSLLALLTEADVLIENFKIGTLEKWGIGYDALQQKFPRLIHCRISGFGADGPMGALPGYDAVVQALSGLMSINGEPEGPPLRMGIAVVDIVTGLNATIGILMALQERVRSGRGQLIDITLFDCALSILHPHIANYLVSSRIPARTGNAHVNITPYDSYRTRTQPIFIGVGNEGQFRKLCEVLEAPQLSTDPRFTTVAARNGHRDALKLEIEQRSVHRDGAELAQTLMRAGVPSGAVLNVAEALASAHAQHRQMVVEIDGYRGTASPIKFSRSTTSYRRKPPRLGEHSAEVLARKQEQSHD